MPTRQFAEAAPDVPPARRSAASGPRLRVCTLAACPFPANHGTPGSIREMAEAVAELGHEVHVVTYHFGEDIPLRGLHLHRITPLTGESAVVVGPTSRRPLYDLQMVVTALGVIRRHRPHLLHAHGYEAALVAFLCRLATGVPVVYSGHNTMGDELASYDFIRPRWLAHALARVLDGLVPRVGDRCLPHSANIQRFLRGMGLARRCEPVVNFGIDPSLMAGGDGRAARARYGLGAGPVVLYAGVMDEFQRIDLLLEAFVRVASLEPAARMLFVVTIAHEAHLARIRRRADELDLADRVVFTDPQPLHDVKHLLAACDVAVVPRPHAPGFPIKLLNYMAARRPCVLFASSASHGLTHRENVFLASPDTAAALGEGILEVLRDAGLRERLARNGQRFVRENHDRRAVARHIVAAYYRTLEEEGRLPQGAACETKGAPGPVLHPPSGRNGHIRRASRPITEILCDVGV